MPNAGVVILTITIAIWIIGVSCIIVSMFVDKEDPAITRYSIPTIVNNKKVYISSLDFDDEDEADVIIISDDTNSTT